MCLVLVQQYLNNMEKTVGIFNDNNDELSNCLMDSYGDVKYKIFGYSYSESSKLSFQTNDKELFIKEWGERYRVIAGIDDIGICFEIKNGKGGGFMDETKLRKYLEENNL